jgi:hypothetical protein
MDSEKTTTLGDEELAAVSGGFFYIRFSKWSVSVGWQKEVDPQAPNLNGIPASVDEPGL